MHRLIVLAALAAATPAAAQPMKLPAVETGQLVNGLRIAVLRIDTAPAVSVQLWYHAGSKDEPRDRRGTARMFEHMMFKGSTHVRAEAHAQMIAALGGYTNATADEDATHYIDTLPSDYMDFAIELEAERMRNLMFRPKMIEIEREVAKDDLRQQDGNPIAKSFLRFLAVAYTKHPYASGSGGTVEDLDKTTADDLKKFYDAYYEPNNAMLVVVGHATMDQVKASAEKWFGKIEKAADPPRPAASAQEPAQTSQRREVVEPAQIGLVIAGWHIPAAKDKDTYALEVASIVLGAGEQSRLMVRLKAKDPKTKRAPAVAGGTQFVMREDPGLVLAAGEFMEPANADAVQAAVLDEVQKLGARGPTPDELKKAKNQVQSGLTFSLEHVQQLADAIGRAWIMTGEPAQYTRELDEVEKVTAADVQRVIKQYMTPEKATIVVIPPKGR